MFICKQGMRFGKWTVVKEVSPHVLPTGKRIRRVRVKCTCEAETIMNVLLQNLKNGRSKSCGCIKIAQSDASGKYHPLYSTYNNMLARCYNNQHPRFKDYGGRGIRVCKQWRQKEGKGFWNFVKWAENNGWSKDCGLTLDRESNEKNYSPANCRWVTVKIQNWNKRNNFKVQYKGKSITANTIIKKYAVEGVKIAHLKDRLSRNWSVEDAISTPVKVGNRYARIKKD